MTLLPQRSAPAQSDGGPAAAHPAAHPAAQPAARVLAEYVHDLRFETLPAEVVQRAQDCLIDTVGAITYGHDFPASRILLQYLTNSGTGPCVLPGAPAASPLAKLTAEAAALAGGTLAHAAELDSLRQPGAGVHPGAVLVPVALSLGQSLGSSGRDVLTALVAGIEVLFRIGRATHHTAESRGFHAPGLTGPYGAAMVAGKLMGLSVEQLTAALGVAGSLGGGLLEFAKAGEGGMVKRLHMGRAAQSGIIAAQLAQLGFDGPPTVLEGPAGFLQAYCEESEPEALTSGLGSGPDSEYETLRICLKRYPCHITAHTVVNAIERFRGEHGFDGSAVAQVRIESAAKVVKMHDIKAPRDLVLAQYSVPFCAAVALFRDPLDPDSFVSPNSLHDPAIRALSAQIEVVDGGQKGWASKVTITLKDGRVFESEQSDFPGCPTQPASREALRAKFLHVTTRLGEARAQALFERLGGLANETELNWLGAAMSAA